MEQRLLWCGKRSLLGFIFGVIFIICNECIIQCNASIHEYRNEAFSPQSNAFFFHGGSEGLYASKVHGSADSSSTDNHHLKGKSFIRSLIYILPFILSVLQILLLYMLPGSCGIIDTNFFKIVNYVQLVSLYM